MDKKSQRLRRAKRGRCLIKKLGAVRLSVHRTNQHIYAQIISGSDGSVITCASTLDKEFKSNQKSAANKKTAAEIGKLIADRAKAKGVEKVAFDRSGFKYHGKIKALADSAREAGLVF